jgi:Transposase/Transposase IS116/IS110/IS902 family
VRNPGYGSWQRAGSKQIERGYLENTPEAVEAWITELRLRFPGRPLAVTLEQRRGALVTMLSKYGELYWYPVHPLTLAKYREAFYPSRSKNDPQDADLLRELLPQHRDRWRRLDPDTAGMRRLQVEVENRRKLVDQQTALSNQLTDLLKLYDPQIPIWFQDPCSILVGDLLRRGPTLVELQRARPATLEKFFHQHNCRDEKQIQWRIEQIRQAVPATHDEAILGPSQLMALVCVEQMACLQRAIHEWEKKIAELARQQPDGEIFASLPGAGEALAPRLIVALGSRRERFQSAHDVQCFAGIAPVKEASGNSQWVHRRWACPKFLRQSFHEWAACSLPCSVWAKAHDDQPRLRNKSHHTAVRALAFKWMRILYRCWKARQPYREEVYLASLARRRLPLAQLLKTV